MHARLRRCMPWLAWWLQVKRRSLRADALAGLTGGLILLPQGVAFATISPLAEAGSADCIRLLLTLTL